MSVFDRIDRREYFRLHKWVARNFKKSGICEFCYKESKTEWSNKSGFYARDRIDWQELCHTCHVRWDRKEQAWLNYKGVKYGPDEAALTRLKSYAWYKEKSD